MFVNIQGELENVDSDWSNFKHKLLWAWSNLFHLQEELQCWEKVASKMKGCEQHKSVRTKGLRRTLDDLTLLMSWCNLALTSIDKDSRSECLSTKRLNIKSELTTYLQGVPYSMPCQKKTFTRVNIYAMFCALSGECYIHRQGMNKKIIWFLANRTTNMSIGLW